MKATLPKGPPRRGTGLPSRGVPEESVNGVMSVRKVGSGASLIPPGDADLVRSALARDPQLRHCAVEVKRDAIVIHEPERGVTSPSELMDLARALGVTIKGMPVAPAHFEERVPRLAPVMKFEPAGVGDTGKYLAFRRTYRGDGGWLPLSHGPLVPLLQKYVKHIGQESFFELM